MGLATPVSNLTRISERSVENPPPAETKTAENPKEKEKLKQDSAKNTTQEASHNENVEIPISSHNKTQNPPKDQKAESKPKTELEIEIPNLSQNATLSLPKTAENLNKTNIEVEDPGPAYGNQTDGTNLNVTSADGRNHSLAKVNEQSDLAPSGGVPFGQKTDLGGFKNSTSIDDRQNQDNSEMIDQSDQTTFSSSSRVSDHVYFPMVQVVLILWLVVHMYPKVKRFFNWIQKSLTKTGRNTRRRMKQKKY